MADPNNKWNQPTAPPPPMFFGKKERDLVKQVNDELAERVIGQSIAYYPISVEESNFNDTYGEALDKISLPPIRVYAYVVVENEQSNDRYGYEYQTKLTVNFHRKRLTADQNLFVRVGDFVQYGDQFYEIVKTYNDTRYYFGQVEHKFQISAECIRARQDAFRVEAALTRPVALTASVGATNAAPAPRAAPYPPLAATYITVTSNSKLPQERVLTAGAGITITDAGANSTVTIASSGQNALGPTGSLQLQKGGGSFSGSANLLFLTASNLWQLTGTAGIQGSLSASANISASAFYGDGSNLTGVPDITGTPVNNQLAIWTDANTLEGDASLTFDGTTLTGSYTGSLAQFTTLSASLMNLVPTSGTLAGGGSYLGLNSSNNLVLTSAASTAGSPGGSTTQVQFNSGSAFGGSSNLTFNGTTLTGSFTGSLAEYTTLTASALQAQNLEVSGGDAQILSSDPGPGTANPTDGRLLFDKVFDNSGEATANKIVLYDDGGVGAQWKAGIGVSQLDVDFFSGDNFRFWTNHGSTTEGDNRVTILTNGNVGIGTDAPDYALDVAGQVGIDRYIYHNGDEDTYLSFQADEVNLVAGGKSVIRLDESGTNDKIKINNTNADIDLQVMADDGEVILHTDAGTNRVGINTITPGVALEVVGAMSASTTLQAVGAATLGSTLAVSGAATLGATGSFSSVNMTGSLSGSSTAVFGSSISSSGDLAVTGNVHAASYYGDGSNLTGVDAVSGSARQYSSTGMETSGYLKASGSVTFAGTGSVSSLVATGSISGSSTFQAVGATVLGSSLGVSGSATFAGGITHNRTAITAATYTILVTDYYIGADTTSNAITLTLPAAATAGAGKTYVVKDEGGNAAANSITVDGDGSETVDGVASINITSPYGAINLYTDGADWFVY